MIKNLCSSENVKQVNIKKYRLLIPEYQTWDIHAFYQQYMSILLTYAMTFLCNS